MNSQKRLPILPYGYTIRQLNYEDYIGYLDLLSQLSTVGNVSELSYKSQFDVIKKNPNHYIFIIESSGKIIVGASTLLIEPKFIHKCCYVGHIEDVVVHKNYRKYGLGSIIIQHIIEFAKTQGCYKIVLSCKTENIPFYSKNNFYEHETTMRIDIKSNL